MKRLDYLLLGLIFILISLFIAVQSFAETRVSTYVNLTNDLGYETGIGAKAEQINRWGWIGFDANGRIAYQKKIDAEEGYTYGLAGCLRLYPYSDVYLGAGYGWSGYDSKFDGDKRWKKDEAYPVAKIGWDGDIFDIEARYTGRGSGPNEVESLGLMMRVDVWSSWFLETALKTVWFDQAGHRDNGQAMAIGFGYVWK